MSHITSATRPGRKKSASVSGIFASSSTGNLSSRVTELICRFLLRERSCRRANHSVHFRDMRLLDDIRPLGNVALEPCGELFRRAAAHLHAQPLTGFLNRRAL